MFYFGDIDIGDNMDIERDKETLLNIIDRAKPESSFPKELWNIISEEREQYMSGSITKDQGKKSSGSLLFFLCSRSSDGQHAGRTHIIC